MGKVQEVADWRMLPILRRLSWYNFCFLTRIQSPRTVRACHSVGSHSLTRGMYVLTPVDAKDGRDCEQYPLGYSHHAGGPFGNGTFFWRYCTFFNDQIFPDACPKIRKGFRQEFDVLPLLVHKWYCCHTNSSFSEVFRLESRGHPNYLGILFPELFPEALYQPWRETFSLLCSQVNWSGNLKSC